MTYYFLAVQHPECIRLDRYLVSHLANLCQRLGHQSEARATYMEAVEYIQQHWLNIEEGGNDPRLFRFYINKKTTVNEQVESLYPWSEAT